MWFDFKCSVWTVLSLSLLHWVHTLNWQSFTCMILHVSSCALLMPIITPWPSWHPNLKSLILTQEQSGLWEHAATPLTRLAQIKRPTTQLLFPLFSIQHLMLLPWHPFTVNWKISISIHHQSNWWGTTNAAISCVIWHEQNMSFRLGTLICGVFTSFPFPGYTVSRSHKNCVWSLNNRKIRETKELCRKHYSAYSRL